MMQPDNKKTNNPDTASVAVRLGRRWRMQPHSAKWKVYSMERGIRGEALEVIRAMQPAQAQLWLQPLIDAAAASSPPPVMKALLGALKATSGAEAAACRYLFVDPSPKHKKDLVEALRRQSAALLEYARSLEGDDD